MKVIFVDLEVHILKKIYNSVISNLKKNNIQSFAFSHWNKECEDANLIILADPIKNSFIKDKLRVFGQRTVNRKERLEIAMSVGSPVTPWISTNDSEELLDFVHQNGQKVAVLKYDWSFARKAVFLVEEKQGHIDIPKDFDNSKDIFMKYLTLDPRTYKAEYFFGHFLGGRITSTPSFNDPEFREAILPVEYWEPDELLNSSLKKLSRKFIEYGAGYISIDLMKDHDGHLQIIEINSNGVGRTIPWFQFPDQYEKSYTNAIIDVVKEIHSLPKYMDVTKNMVSVNFLQ